MTESVQRALAEEASPEEVTALPGEPGIPHVAEVKSANWSRKGLLAVGLLATLVIGGAVAAARHYLVHDKPSDEAGRRAGDKPAAAAIDVKALEMPGRPAPSTVAASQPGASTGPRIPGIVASDDEVAEPIGVRRTGAGSGTGATSSSGSKSVSPEDGPTMLVAAKPGTSNATAQSAPGTTRPGGPMSQLSAADIDPATDTPLAATQRNLQDYQRQLQGLMDTLTRTATAAVGGSPNPPPSSLATPISLPGIPNLPGVPGQANAASQAGTTSTGLLGGQLPASTTPRVSAGTLGNRSLTLPKGTAFTCALKTKVISAQSGLVGCQVQRNVYSDDGRVLLVERGSHLDGEYRILSIRAGTVRIPVLWTRLRTPLGVTVDIESPGVGPLGEAGIGGYVDNRWPERIGAAMLLSLIDDSVQMVIQNQGSDHQGDTLVLPSTTANTSKLAEKVLDSTINIPPLIYQNQGGVVGIYVARDVDFSSVYELTPGPR